MHPEQTVFVVDDDPAALTSVAALVKSNQLPVETFESAERFLAAYQPRRRGCLVVDVSMTGMTGLELQDTLRDRSIRLPVIVITGYADVQMAVRAMRAGAVTFLEKPCGVQQLWSAIRQALHWESELARQHARRAEIESQMAQLTPDELKVFELVVEGRPNKVIASELDIGLRTVELRRASVIKKLHAGSLAELVRKTLIVRGGEDRE